MQPDNPRAHLARQWLTYAQLDLAASERLLADPSLPAGAAFHAQQAAEKALKGLLAWHNLPFARTHDLAELVQQAAAVAPDLLSFRPTLAVLARYAVEARDPGFEPEPPADEAWDALALARQVVQLVRDRLPPEAQP